MKKRTVGIYANYDASEQSLCAEFLAGYVMKCYRYVKWFVPRDPKSDARVWGFSHQWDSDVVPWIEGSERVRKAVAECDTFFFFEPNERLWELLPKKAVTASVVGPGLLSEDRREFAKRCTFTLMPCEPSGAELYDPPANAIYWPFDPSIQCIMRSDLDYENQPKLLFPAFGFHSWERTFVRQVAEIVKLCKPNVKTVLAYYDANAKPYAGCDSRTHDWRLIRYMQNTDWIIDLNFRPSYCLFGACAGGYGLQWIGLDLAPNTDAANAARRHLISCYDRRAGKAKRIVPDLESTAAQIVACLDTPFHGPEDRHRSCGAWENRRAEFLRVTNLILGIKTKY